MSALAAGRPALYTRQFLVILVSSVFFFIATYLLLAALPLYVDSTGAGPAVVGLVMGTAPTLSFLTRPPVGSLLDNWSRRNTMLLGSLAYIATPLLFMLPQSVPTLMLIRGIQGAGFSCFSTASMTIAADMAPATRRGEALGVLGAAAMLAMIVSPTLGVEVAHQAGFNALFLLAASAGVLSLVLGWWVRDVPHHIHGTHPPTFLSVLRERGVALPSLLVAACGLTFGVSISFIPLYGTQAGIGNPGLFFGVYAAASMLVRGPLGALSDRVGRKVVVVPLILLMSLSLLLLWQLPSLEWLVLVAVLYGIGFGPASPLLTALAVDKTGPEARGSAVGAVNGGFDLGMALGGFVLGTVVAVGGFGLTFVVTGLLCLAALGWFLVATRGW